MSQRNLIEVRIPEADLAEIWTAVATLKDKLLPRLQTLSPQERHEIPKMGDKTVAFVQKAHDYAKANPTLTPAYLDVAAMGVDLGATKQLHEILQPLTMVTEALSDSVTLSGSEAYQGALVFYTNIKAAAKSKVAGASVIYDDLSARFPGYTAKKKGSST
jgi:hypothetical protein